MLKPIAVADSPSNLLMQTGQRALASTGSCVVWSNLRLLPSESELGRAAAAAWAGRARMVLIPLYCCDLDSLVYSLISRGVLTPKG